ncbi:MAG: HD domain-containing protein [Armatimonadetes bacterium]|nr:HD domain-containing protein [Armatimonadota bacterium]
MIPPHKKWIAAGLLPIMAIAGAFRLSGAWGCILLLAAGGCFLAYHRLADGRLYRIAFDQVSEGVLLIHPSSLRILKANRAAARILGHPASDIIAMTCLELFGKENRAACCPDFPAEQSYLRPGGDSLRLRLSVASIGRAMCLTVQDITREKEAGDTIRRQADRFTALCNVDRVISTSLNLRMILQLFIDESLSQLKVDTAAVLLCGAMDRDLTYAAGKGFFANGSRMESLKAGLCEAGARAMEQGHLHFDTLTENHEAFTDTGILREEGFQAYYAIPLVAKGRPKGVLQFFHRSPLAPDPDWLEFLNALAGQAAIAIDNATLFESIQRTNMELTRAYDATVAGLSSALELRDHETKGHSQRVTELTLILACALDITDETELGHIRLGALLHDIGKIGVPDRILLKPGPLDDEEWEAMRKHPKYAYDMLSSISFLGPALGIPYCHHEKWDGTGYPRGLKGADIPLPARIFAVVDVWDALRSDRPYRKSWPEEKVREYIRSLSGTHFDPQVVEAFLRLPSFAFMLPNAARQKAA